MTKERLSQLASLEGQRISVALRGGSRIDDCHLVSAGRGRVASLWLVAAGQDTFVALSEVVDVWQTAGRRSRAA
jgi:hypothetical protein